MTTWGCDMARARHRSLHGAGLRLYGRTEEGEGLSPPSSSGGAVWHHAFFHRRLGALRASWGHGAPCRWQGTPAAHGAGAHHLADAAPTLRAPDDLLFADGADARSGHWTVYQPLCVQASDRI